MKNKKTKSGPIRDLRWECPSCKYRAKTSFCPNCGEAKPLDHPITFLELFKQLFNGITSLDGRFIRSVRYLVAHPGVLTTAYMQGRHVPYLGPIQLFLAANVLFFAVQSLTNTNIVSSSLESHLHVQDWSPYAQALVDQRLAVKNISLAEFAPRFDQAVVFYGKMLIVLMVLPFTLFVYLSTMRKRRPFVTHIVFALHFYTFLLLLFCVSLVVVEVNVLLGGGGLGSAKVDTVVTLIDLAICIVYLHLAFGVVYDKRRIARPLIAIAARRISNGHSSRLSLSTFSYHTLRYLKKAMDPIDQRSPQTNGISAFMNSYPLVSFFILAYAISWGSFMLLSGPGLFPFGSLLAAVIVAAVTQGTSGLKDLASRCLRWPVKPVWFLAALMVPAAIACAALYLNAALGSPLPPMFAGAWWQALLILPMAVFDAPLWEDSGWRGFAMPRFPADRSRLMNTLILGILLAGWHSPIAISAGWIAIPYLITTVLSAFVTNWIYYKSNNNAMLAILYHGAANAMGIAFFQGYTGADQLRLFWLLAATNLAAVAVIIITGRKMWFGSDQESRS